MLNTNHDVNFIYTDRDELSADGTTRSNPLFKAGWSPQVLMSANYLTHLCVLRTDHVRELGGWRSETDGAQDWDLFLRATSQYGGVHHIPKILYHWRHASSSVSATGLAGKPFAKAAQVRTVESYCRSANLPQSTAFLDGHPKIVWRLSELPSISVIVLSNSLEPDVAERIAQRPECEGTEVIHATYDTVADQESGVKYVPVSAGDDTVEQANQLVAASTGDVLVIVDAGVRLESSDWLRELVGPLSLPGVGMCGCHLVDHLTGEVTHVGLAFDDEGNASPVRLKGQQDGFLHGAAHWLRNWAASSGACFAVARTTWNEVHGFYAPHGHSRPDIRLCLNLAEKGLRIVTNPAARVRQSKAAALETPLHPQGEFDRQVVRTAFPHGDPHINTNLHLKDGLLIPR